MEVNNASIYNLKPEVLQTETLNDFSPNLYDTTLRDGEQTAGVSFNKNEKIEIAKLLDEIGIKRIEAGLPVISKEDREAVETIASMGLKAEIWGFSRCVASDIDVNAEVGVNAVICEIATSEAKLKAYNFTEDSVYEKAMKSVIHAKEKGMRAAFFAVDATKTRLEFLKRICVDAVRIGKADELVIPDTMGGASPETVSYLVRQLKQWIDVPVHIHCHNDLALGTACSLAGIRAGADWIHVAVNGLGERSGNCDLAEVAVAAKLIYNVDFGLNLAKLKYLSKEIERISGIKLSPMKPIVGDNIFTRDSGMVVAQLRQYPPAVELYPPEMVGQERSVLINKKSGNHSVEYVLERLGYDVTPEQVTAIVTLVKAAASQRKDSITDEELLGMYRQVKSS
jgi:isopropylmalate/homocitrate/citramalate synthase